MCLVHPQDEDEGEASNSEFSARLPQLLARLAALPGDARWEERETVSEGKDCTQKRLHAENWRNSINWWLCCIRAAFKDCISMLEPH